MMQKDVFEHHLEQIADQLRSEARQAPFTTSKQFENRVREIAQEVFSGQGICSRRAV